MPTQGLVLKSTGSWYDVLGADGVKYPSRVRGKIRLEGIKETNPVAVGDHVMIDIQNQEGIITEILPRTNHMLRQSVKKTGHSHVLAANIDQALLVVTLSLPRTSLGFIDRFLVSAEAFRIPQILVINKSDLLDADGKQLQKSLVELYTSIGVTCIATSALFDDQSPAHDLLKNKITLVAGHSGVGKSTWINTLSPSINQRTSEISDYSEKGTHTTTFAEMFQLDTKTFIIDTPGVKEWGLVEMHEQELSDYFPEMRSLRLDCKFGSKCLHINEPKCAIQQAVKEGGIALSRFESYLSMIANEDNRK
jgi:ribosome biogenesis GTPase